MNLHYDPSQPDFWQAIRSLPGYPIHDAIRLRSLQISTGAIFQLPQVLNEVSIEKRQPLLVVMDQTPMQRGPESLKPLVLRLLQAAGYEIIECLLKPDQTGQVHTDFQQIHFVKEHLAPGIGVLSVGSGVVTDIAKHACYLYEEATGQQIPLVVFQTANSVNAFTSNMAPTFVDGVKRTLPSRYPDALVCDLETLRDAPCEMTVAGVGDLLSAAVSFPDWYLANQLGMDPGYSSLAQELMGSHFLMLQEEADSIRAGNLEGTALLTKLIHLSGLCMSLAHATTPFSGFEHVLSHILDLENELTGQPLAPHGSQVALAAILGADTYHTFLREFDPSLVEMDQCYPSLDEMHTHIEGVFREIDPSGKAGAECWRDYAVKLEAWHANRETLGAFLENWEEIRATLQALVAAPEFLLQILAAVDAPISFPELSPGATEPVVRFAYLNAPLMRKRLTIGDALIYFGLDREKAWEKASKWVFPVKPAGQ